MASIKFEWVDLASIWNPEVTHHPAFIKAVNLIVESEDAEFDNRHSWLHQTIFEDRYAADEEEDEAMLERFGNVDSTHYAWYLALQHCDKYALIMGAALELLYPHIDWVVAYTPDHYFCLDRSALGSAIIPIYDLLGHCRIESGCVTPSTAWAGIEHRWSKRHVVRSVTEHMEMVRTGGYD